MTKIKIDREMLLDKLKKVFKFVPTASAIPAHENIRFIVFGDNMELLAADPMCQIKTYCRVKSSQDVSFCLPARLLLKTIDLFRENEVVITIKDEKKIELKCGKSKYNITVDCKAEDFPTMDYKDDANKSEFSIMQANLKMGLTFSGKFIEDTSAKVNANGININKIGNRMIFTGLDGFTCGRVNVEPLGVGSWNANFVLPEESANKISSMLTDNGEINISHNGSKMMLFTDESIEKFEIITTSMTTKFADSEKVFSKRGQDCMIVNTLELKDAIKRLSLYTSTGDGEKRVVMSTVPDNISEILITSCDKYTYKDGEEVMTVNNKCGKPILKGFNADFILKILACIDTTDIMVFYSDDKFIPVFIQPVTDRENNFDYLIATTSTD